MRKRHALGSLLIVSVTGVPAYFVAFLFAYGFQDSVDVADHALFLILIGVFAAVAGCMSLAVPLAHSPYPALRRRLAFGVLAFGVLASLSLNAAVVGVGSIVSATHKNENSVSQDFSTLSDVLVAVGLFVVAASLALAAHRIKFWAGPALSAR